MKSILRSIWMWIATITLILVWLPLLGVVRLFDRDPVRLRTGLWFRRLGRAIVKSNPAWRVHISGIDHAVARQPYIVVSNHQSVVDIPLISCLPWEMKWIAKDELFRVPVVGWMMRLAGDIPLDRSYRNGARALLRAKSYLQQQCPVMFFPEGTRSVDDRVHAFTDGAFYLAIKGQVPVLPLAVEGTHSCLSKGSWRFGDPREIHLKVLPPLSTQGMSSKDVGDLRDRVRGAIVQQLAEWRATTAETVDALARPAPSP
jgi:1-acyl-sn-glycerol-3-phosphate acyltransferase